MFKYVNAMSLAQQLLDTIVPGSTLDPQNVPVALAWLEQLAAENNLDPGCKVDTDDEGSIYCSWPNGRVACIVSEGALLVEYFMEEFEDLQGQWEFPVTEMNAACRRVALLLHNGQ